MTDLLQWRKEFPILETTTYLISNSFGAMPRRAIDRLSEYTQLWATRGAQSWHEAWWDKPRQIADKVAPLIGADAGTVSIQLNITSAEAVVASCFDFSGPRNKVVFEDMNFPSVAYFWREQQRIGARIEVVPTDGVHVDTERMLDAIDDTTLLVPVSHVLFRSAFIQDAEAICQKAHKVGARVVLDTYQSTGILPVNAKKLGVDFVVGGTLKWLCGGPGVAFLYVRPDLAAKLEPRFTGWFAHQKPFDFDFDNFVRTDDSYRFMNGTPNIPGLYACEAGLDIIGQIGVEAIRSNSMRQTAKIIEMAQSRGWEVTAPLIAEVRAGTVALDLPDSENICNRLIAQDILVDYRPKAGVRISPHFYTSDEEIDAAFTAIEQIMLVKAL
jgi:kynureninase